MGPAQTYLWLTIIPLTALVVVARYRRLLVETDRHSYRHIASGLTSLAIASLLSLFRSNGVLAFSQGLVNPLLVDMTIWILTIVGSVLTAAGVSQWLPLSREYRRLRQSKLNRLQLLRRVEQLIAVEERPRRILMRTLEEFVELGEYGYGQVYALSRSARRFNLIHSTATVRDDEPDEMLMSETDILRPWIEDQAAPEAVLAVPLADGGSRPVAVLPIRSGEHLYGVFALYPDASVVDGETAVHQDLVLIADILARKILLDRHRLACELRSRRTHWRDEIASALDERKDLKANLAAVGGEILRGVNGDFLSISIVVDQRVMHRFSMLAAGSLLQEAGLNLHRQTTHVSQIIADGRTLVVDDLQRKADIVVDMAIRDNGMRSLLAIPIERIGRPAAVVTVASRVAGRFTVRERAMLRSLSPVLSDAVADEIARSSLALREKSLSGLGLLIDEAAESGCMDVLYAQAAELLSSELQPTVVRITTFDDDRSFLKSRALVALHNAPAPTPADATMILSLLPRHRLVHDTGRVLLINQAQLEQRMAEAEGTLMFCPGVQSALLAPIKSGGRVDGFISLADVRSWERSHYRHKDILLVRSVASLLGLAQRTVNPWSAALPRAVETIAPRRDTGRPNRSNFENTLGQRVVIDLAETTGV